MNRDRNGVSMIEMLITMSVASALLAVNVVWLHHAMSFSRQMNNRQRHHQQLTRLSRQLRDDVRACENVSVKKDELTLQFAGGTTTYTISGNSILLEKKLMSPPGSVKRERFSFSKHSIAEWDQSELPKWISLTVRRLPETHQPIFDQDDKPKVVDLHVRVATNRWPDALVGVTASSETKQAEVTK